jgi:homoserine O-acetyltransferase/O-succinyltransferase
VLDTVPEQCDNYYTRIVEDQRFAIIPSMQLESGLEIQDCPIAFKTWGRLNEEKDNVIVICHALTGSADASDWWRPLFGPGKALDYTRFFIFCANVLGSPYGSASSLTVDQKIGELFGPDFPRTTIRDDVR